MTNWFWWSKSWWLSAALLFIQLLTDSTSCFSTTAQQENHSEHLRWCVGRLNLCRLKQKSRSFMSSVCVCDCVRSALVLFSLCDAVSDCQRACWFSCFQSTDSDSCLLHIPADHHLLSAWFPQLRVASSHQCLDRSSKEDPAVHVMLALSWCSVSVLCSYVLKSIIRDKVEPLVFSLNASLYEKFPKKKKNVQDLKRLPVLSETPRPIRTQVRTHQNLPIEKPNSAGLTNAVLVPQIHIQKACGSDNRCHSNLQMTARFTDESQQAFPEWVKRTAQHRVQKNMVGQKYSAGSMRSCDQKPI